MTPDLLLSPVAAVLFVSAGRWLGSHPQHFYPKRVAITNRRATFVRRLGIGLIFLGLAAPSGIWAAYFGVNLAAVAIPVGLVGTWALQPRSTPPDD